MDIIENRFVILHLLIEDGIKIFLELPFFFVLYCVTSSLPSVDIRRSFRQLRQCIQ